MKRAKQPRVIRGGVLDSIVGMMYVADKTRIESERQLLAERIEAEINRCDGRRAGDAWFRTDYDILQVAWRVVAGRTAYVLRKRAVK
jgi:hypothetical protein